MALIAVHLELIRTIQHTLLGKKQMRVLSLGYPDVLVGKPTLAALYGDNMLAQLRERQDAEGILKWHGLSPQELPGIVETESLFECLGATVDYVDIAPSRGVEHQLDLNEPLPESYHGRYDLVLDLGTTEHCFNIGQAMKNVASALAVSGCVLHSTPFHYYDHGFFNFSPSFYRDFYQQNGFTLKFMKGLFGTPLHYQLFDFSPALRKTQVPAGSIMLVIARKQENCSLRWPMQSKYLAPAQA